MSLLSQTPAAGGLLCWESAYISSLPFQTTVSWRVKSNSEPEIMSECWSALNLCVTDTRELPSAVWAIIFLRWASVPTNWKLGSPAVNFVWWMLVELFWREWFHLTLRFYVVFLILICKLSVLITLNRYCICWENCEWSQLKLDVPKMLNAQLSSYTYRVSETLILCKRLLAPFL